MKLPSKMLDRLNRRSKAKRNYTFGKPSRRLRVECLEGRRLLAVAGTSGGAEQIELLLTARDQSDSEIAPNAEGDISVTVGEIFNLEIAYRDLRGFDATGAFAITADIASDDNSSIIPALTETHLLTVDADLSSAASGNLTFSLENSSNLYVSALGDFANNPLQEISTALLELGYTSDQFEVSVAFDGTEESGYRIRYVDTGFVGVDLPNLTVEANLDVSVPVSVDDVPPVNGDGSLNGDAVAHNLNLNSRTFGNEPFYSNAPSGTYSAATGFDEVGAVGQVVVGGVPGANDGNFEQPFDAFSVPVMVTKPVTGLGVSLNPSERIDGILLYDAGYLITPEMILLDGDSSLSITTTGNVDGPGDDEGPGNPGGAPDEDENIAPTASIELISATRVEGGEIAVTANATDPDGADDSLTYEYEVFKLENGSSTLFASNSAVGLTEFSFTPDDNGSYKILLTAVDQDGGTATASQTIDVENVAPTITGWKTDAAHGGEAAEQDTVEATLEFTDPGLLDSHTVVVDWGDGSSDTIPLTNGQRTIQPTHEYTTGGVFDVAVSVEDDDAGVDWASTTAVITGVGVVGDTLYVVGTDAADQVSINQTGKGTLKVHADFLDDQPRSIDPADYPAGIEQVSVILYGSDDHATISSRVTLPAIIDGGAGNDHLKAGGDAAVLLGGEGDDRLIGGYGNDILIGGLGTDRIVGGHGEDVMAGGSSSYGSDSNTAALVDDEALLGFLRDWSSTADRSVRESDLADFVGSLDADGDEDKLTGASDEDWFLEDSEDLVTGLISNGKGNGGK